MEEGVRRVRGAGKAQHSEAHAQTGGYKSPSIGETFKEAWRMDIPEEVRAAAKAVQRETGVTKKGYQFSKISGSTGVERYVLRQEDAPGVNLTRENSLTLLTEAGLVFVEYKIEIPLLVRDWELQRALTNNGQFISLFVAGRRPLNLPAVQHVNKKGKIVNGEGDIENTIRNFDGEGSLWLDVDSDGDALDYERRFVLNTDWDADYVVRVVYGKLAEANGTTQNL
jgi:hypothetical protein